MPEYIEKAQVLGIINTYASIEKVREQKFGTCLTDSAIEEHIKHGYCKNVLLEIYDYVDKRVFVTHIEEN